MTYQEAYQKATGELKAAGIPEPESDSWILLEHVTGMTRTRYYVDGFERMPKNEEDRFFELVSCRKTRIPVQHLTGVQEFMGYEFAVNEHVLVPRQDTEILVEEAEKRLLLMKKENPVKVLDMCTGSGCIPISLKLRNPQIVIEGADISEEALKVAEKNAKKLGVSGKWIQTDMFENITGTFDMIFMDAAKGQYIHWLPDVLRLMKEGSVLVSDNVLQEGDIIESHYLVERRNRTIYKRMREYLWQLTHSPVLRTSVLPLGDGAAVSVKTGEQAYETTRTFSSGEQP